MPWIDREQLSLAIAVVNDASGTHRVRRVVEMELLRLYTGDSSISYQQPSLKTIEDLRQEKIDSLIIALEDDGSWYSRLQRRYFTSPRRIASEMLADGVNDCHWRDVAAAQQRIKDNE